MLPFGFNSGTRMNHDRDSYVKAAYAALDQGDIRQSIGHLNRAIACGQDAEQEPTAAVEAAQDEDAVDVSWARRILNLW